ncbi:hypothetical protein Acor_23520 [Acrocarpospora corrugata]|uniref:Subtilisin inhibitor domain-containing protein n=1 Tax=Acrocarpospora corrugata TaxID=35763 RepID=A0A5M3VVS7_9ACTN|nr:hypothetical protein [Acrocarpospora corrugata]GES00289.1 hypothetical protein Acor_23520 [Acrocarpospora corrugata]
MTFRKIAAGLCATAMLLLAVPATATASGPRVDLLIHYYTIGAPNWGTTYTVTCDPDGGTGETDLYMDIWRVCDDFRQAGGDLDKLNSWGLGIKCASTPTGTIHTRITGTSYGQTVDRDQWWPDWTCLRRNYGYMFIY